MFTVYTTGPSCQRCNLTKRAMDKRGLPYVEVGPSPLIVDTHVVNYAASATLPRNSFSNTSGD